MDDKNRVTLKTFWSYEGSGGREGNKKPRTTVKPPDVVRKETRSYRPNVDGGGGKCVLERCEKTTGERVDEQQHMVAKETGHGREWQRTMCARTYET
jgi:hypothetical protein